MEKRSGPMIAVWAHPSIRQKLVQIKDRTDCSLSDLCYRLILRGLDEYEKDGVLANPVPQSSKHQTPE